MIQLVIYILLQIGVATGNPQPNNETVEANVPSQIGNGGWDFDNR